MKKFTVYPKDYVRASTTSTRTKFTTDEWNAILHLTEATHLDESFDAYTKKNGEDCFKDFDSNGRLKSIPWGLKMLYEGIAYPPKHDGLSDAECRTLVNLFKEFKIGNDSWYEWLLSEDEG